MNRYYSIALAGIVLAGAAYRPAGLLTKPKTVDISANPAAVATVSAALNPQAPTPAPPPPVRAFDEAVERIHEFLDLNPLDAARDDCLRAHGYQGEFLFVTVPHPIQSHYGFQFDRAIESLQRAAQASGFVSDRFWFPWGEERLPEGATPEAHDRQVAINARIDTTPGLMLFRKGSSPALLIAFLIPEMPSAGVNKAAFENAMADYRHLAKPGNADRLLIAGPSFSGSVPSLRTILRKQPYRYRIVTGEATASTNKAELADCPNVLFESVIENDQYAYDLFFEHYLKQQQVSMKDVALITETGSSYSQAMAEHFRQRSDPPLLLYVPMEISRVRNAYQDDSDLAVLSVQKTAPAPRQTLKLELKDPHSTLDSIPMFSPDLMAVSEEAALLNLVNTISRERVKFVSVLTTNVLDTLFLSRLVRRNCPDVRIVLFDSDVLYTHEEDGPALYGTLLVSTYSLFSRNQYWTGAKNRRVQFSSAVSEGLYNACRLLLAEAEGTQPSRLLDYSWPLIHLGRPPLWVSTLGRDGVWPVAALWNDPGEAKLPGRPESSLATVDQPPPDAPKPIEPPSRTWSFGFFLLTLMAMAHSALFVYHNWFEVHEERNWLAAFRLGSNRGFRSSRAGFLLLATATLTVLYFLASAIECGYLFRSAMPSRWLISMLALTTVAMLFNPALKTSGILLARWNFGSGIVLSLLLTIAAAAGYLLSTYVGTTRGLFFVERSIHPSSGLSPVGPIVFIGIVFYAWALMHLRRLRLDELRNPHLLPLPFGPDGDCREMTDFEKGILQGLQRTFFNGFEVKCVLAVFLVTVLLQKPWDPPRSLEVRYFDWIYYLCLLAAYAAALFTVARLVWIWVGLKGMLHRLEWHPIRSAFSRLPEDCSWAPLWQRGGMLPSDNTLTRSVEKLCQMQCHPALSPDLREELQAKSAEIRSQVDDFLSCESRMMVGPRDQLAGARQAMIAIGSDLIERGLRQRWSRGCAIAPETGAALSAEEQIERAAEEFIALRYVAFIRYVVLQMRNLVRFLSIASVFAAVSLNCYPFEPHQGMILTFTAVFLALGGCVIAVFMQMDRDAVMSRMTKTEAGKLDGNFFWRLVTVGSVPLLTVISSQFPSVGRFLFAWVGPMLGALK